MKKLILVGRVAAGKTTLTQALKGEQLHYCKTQYINYFDTIIDTPGEYTEVKQLGAA
ncbi:MAG: ethanolamine utilization protein EutP, partial [Clostridia bacterium]|nr:ethanolamine utilization protein EutP [Clostridia bacterium]